MKDKPMEYEPVEGGSVEDILNDPDNSRLLLIPGSTSDVVIGVPHHAPLGVAELPCKEHPDADENAGFLGFYISRLLNCPCIIACNYFLDPNKDESTDYSKSIIILKPKILIEIHGHGGKLAKFGIEISSGSRNNNFWSRQMANRLQKRLSDVPVLQNYSLSGNFNDIHFKATRSFTITTDLWVAFHIELPKELRQDKSHYDPFCENLAETIAEILSNFDALKEQKSTDQG